MSVDRTHPNPIVEALYQEYWDCIQRTHQAKQAYEWAWGVYWQAQYCQEWIDAGFEEPVLYKGDELAATELFREFVRSQGDRWWHIPENKQLYILAVPYPQDRPYVRAGAYDKAYNWHIPIPIAQEMRLAYLNGL